MSAEFEPLIKIDANDGCRNCETIDGEYECVDDITDAPLEFPAYKIIFFVFFYNNVHRAPRRYTW